MLKNFISKALLVTVSVLVTLVMAEIALRITDVGFRSLGGKLHFFTWNPHTGISLRAGEEGMLYVENVNHVRINSQGFHDIEHTKDKPAHTFRIVVLGDSFTEALQLPIEKSFSHVMERELARCAALNKNRAEVINLGVSGYGTAQELQTLRHDGWDYAPDLVLLAFFTGNDIQNNTRQLQEDPYRPYFVHQDGKLVLDDSFLNAPGWKSQFGARHQFVSWALANSHVLQVAAAAKNYLKRRNVQGMRQTEMGLNDAIYRAPTEPVWQEAWSVTEDLLSVMSAEIKAKNKLFLVVSLSSSIQVDPDAGAREQMMQRLRATNLFYPDERVSQLAQRLGVPVLTLAPAFLQYAQQHNLSLHGFSGSRQGHWNEAGHKLGGELMAHKVCEMLSLSIAR